MNSLRDFLPPVKNRPGTVALDTVPVRVESSAVVAAPIAPQHGISKTIALRTDESGRPDFSSVVKQGENATRIVHASRSALVEKSRDDFSLAFPSDESALEIQRRTQATLDARLSKKLAASHKTSHHREKDTAPKFIKYTPANANPSQNSGSSTRIIKMMTAQVDPMEPPRFAQKKAPMNPPSPPVPVLHSPERKLSKEEAAEWKIPPVISNWKNARGYTVPLDKRLSADGRGEPPPLSNRLAEFADALYHAERQARADVEKRAQLQRSASLRQKEAQESQLRDLAKRAREERAGVVPGARRVEESPPRPPPPPLPVVDLPNRPLSIQEHVAISQVQPSELSIIDENVSTTTRRRRSRFDIGPGGVHIPPPVVDDAALASEVDTEDNEAALKRDEIRRERREQREKELRVREHHGDIGDGLSLKRTKLTRDRDRDMSERVALGQGAAGNAATEVMYDQRLFNQGERDAGRGFGSADMYNIYDGALFNHRPGSSFQYRPKDGLLGNQAPSQRGVGASEVRRDRPVEFERDVAPKAAESDPYGVDKLFSDAIRGRPDSKK